MKASHSIIIIGLLFLVVVFFLFKSFDKYENNIKTDIVITWVNDDEEFKKEKEYWIQKENSESNKNKEEDRKRFTNHQELKYCLRSIEKYYPDYRNIYLVVKDGQFPNYLKKDHPSLRVINHSEIIPNEYLPTFNSCAVEAYLHHIPNLSENYLYFNDDFVLLQKLRSSYFMNKNNIPYNIHIGKKNNKSDISKINLNKYTFSHGFIFNNYFLNKITNTNEARYTVAHIPKMYKKSFDFEIENKLKKIYIDPKINCYDKTGMSKFRRNDNLYLNVILKFYLYVYWYNAEFKQTKLVDIQFTKRFNYNLKIKKEYPFLSISDVHDDSVDDYFGFMNTLFPDKSSFEL